jgi:ribosomal protein L12E/L44/L45/RPP1/RPP2
MKTILASFLAVAFLASTPAFAADNPAGSEKGDKADKSASGAKKDDKKKDESKKDDKKAGGGW